MTLVGIIVAVIGVLGFLANFLQIYPMPGYAGDIRIWGAVAIIGVVTAVLTRRPGD